MFTFGSFAKGVYTPQGQRVYFREHEYQNGRLAIQMVTKNGDPIGNVTVNVSEINLDHFKDHESDRIVIVKSWSENEGLLEALEKADLVDVLLPVTIGYGTGYICRWRKP